MFSYKTLPLKVLAIVILLPMILGFNNIWDHEYFYEAKLASNDPVMSLLGESFTEIRQVLGEPDEEGYSEEYGSNYYLLYRHKNGVIRYLSPQAIKNKVAVMIVLEGEQEVLEVKVGMSFQEIRSALGEPDFGPEPGMGDMYYMDYYFGEIKNQIPQSFLSFTAKDINSPTYEAIIKLESYSTNLW